MSSKFSKRHSEAIALAMQAAHPFTGTPEVHDQWAECCLALADMLGRDNGSFKRERFLRACVPGANVKARS